MPIIGTYDQYLTASNGIGEAVRANVVVDRGIGNAQINVDTVLNWPAKFIATVGTLNVTTGIFTPGTVSVFFGHLSGSYIIIDEYSPGYTDIGNTANQIVVLKPTTSWADKMSATMLNAMKSTTYDPAGVAEQLLGVVAAQSPKNKTFDNTSPTAFMYPGLILPYVARTAPAGWLVADGSAVSRTTYASLFGVLNASLGTFATTIATPAVVTRNAHGLSTGDSVYLTTTGALPTGLVANTVYYAVRIDANTFNLSTTRANAYAGTKIATTGTQSGIHTVFDSPYGIGDGSTTFNLPDARGRSLAALDLNAGTAAGRLSLAQSQGVYGNLGANGGEQGHTNTIGETPNETGSITMHSQATATNIAAVGGVFASGFTNGAYVSGGTGASGPTSVGIINFNNGGGGSAHNNVQPTLLVNYIIKT